MRMKDRMHLILDPRPVPNHLKATGGQPAPSFRSRVRCPDLGQIACRMAVANWSVGTATARDFQVISGIRREIGTPQIYGQTE